MSITANLEKAFFHHILATPSQFKDVESSFFKNEDVKFVYDCVRKDFDAGDGRSVPTLTEIRDIVKMNDKTNRFSNELIKEILKINKAQYREEWISEKFKAWKIANIIKNGCTDYIDLIRDLDETNYNDVTKACESVRDLVNKATSLNHVDDDELGSDFDDAESHNQEINATKIPSAFPQIDAMTGGGWDRKALSILIGETNSGKSIWLQNISVNAANAGFNVLVISLEMSEKKVIKRTGAIRLRIPINEYDTVSRDREFIQERLSQLKNRGTNDTDLFEKKLGKIWVKEFPAGTLTVTALDDYIEKLERHLGIKFDMLVIDYITIMCPEKRLNIDNMLYLKGKHLAEGIRAIGQKRDMAVITVTQIAKEKFGASDLNLNDMPESKAISETADAVWGIIRNAKMKAESIYLLKALKLRDADFNFDKIKFSIDRKYLKLEEIGLIEEQ